MLDGSALRPIGVIRCRILLAWGRQPLEPHVTSQGEVRLVSPAPVRKTVVRSRGRARQRRLPPGVRRTGGMRESPLSRSGYGI